MVVTPLHVQNFKYLYVADVRANPDYWTNNIVEDFLKVDAVVRTCDYEPSPLPIDLTFLGQIHDESECRLHPVPPPAHK